MNARSLILLVCVLALGVSAPASAFDGRRTGFLLGGGLGLGSISFTQKINDVGGLRVGKGALVTDFKIGGGLSEQVLLYYDAHLTWFSIRNVFDTDVTIASGISGVGVTWFPRPEPRGIFLKGTVGVATWDAPFEEGYDAWTSLGLGVGLGFEFAPHWAVDLSFLWGEPERTEGGVTAKSDFFAFIFTVTGLAY